MYRTYWHRVFLTVWHLDFSCASSAGIIVQCIDRWCFGNILCSVLAIDCALQHNLSHHPTQVHSCDIWIPKTEPEKGCNIPHHSSSSFSITCQYLFGLLRDSVNNLKLYQLVFHVVHWSQMFWIFRYISKNLKKGLLVKFIVDTLQSYGVVWWS